jgi:type I restriction enzyme S subunit
MGCNSLPKGWQWSNLEHVVNLNMGQSPPSSTYNTQEIGLPFFQGKAEFGEIYPTVERWCSEPKKVAEKGDILLSIRAPVGPINLAPSTCCIGRGLAALRARSDVLDQAFLYYYLLAKEEYLEALGSGSTFQSIRKHQIEDFPIPLPPLSIQRRIVTILKQADKLCHKRTKAIELAERIPSALFVGMFGDPTTNPMGWAVVKLDEAATIIMGQSPPSSTYNTEEVGLPFFQGKAEFGKIYPSIERWCSDPKKIAEKGDILLSVRAPVGPVNLAPSECCVGRGLAAIRGDQHRLVQKWLFYNLSIRGREISRMGSGSTFHAITSEDVKQIPIALPPFKLQQRFAKMVNQFEAQHKRQSLSSESLDDLFESLLTRAFQGELTADLTLQEAFGFTDRQMALLRILNDAAQIQEPVLVTSAMKYAFLFQTEGTQAGQRVETSVAELPASYVTDPAYDFEPYKYGPFAKELYDDLEALEANGLVRIERPPKSEGALREKTEIYLVEDQVEVIDDILDELPSTIREATGAVIAEYGNLSQKQLLNLVYQRYPKYSVNSELHSE